jgi:nucleoside 2-deoxyribosyltransferase
MDWGGLWRAKATSVLQGNVIDPMRRDHRGREAVNVKGLVDADLDDIATCDAVLVNATRPSWGTAMEIVYARQSGKFIVAFFGDGDVSPWLLYHCDVLVKSLSRALFEIQIGMPK